MKLQVLTKVLMVTAIAFGITTTASQASSASRVQHPDRCNTDSRNNCNNNRHNVCNDRRADDCNSNRPNICNDDRPNNCHDANVDYCNNQHPNTCQNNRNAEEMKPPQMTNRFFCGDNNGVPTTFVETQKGSFPVIRWVSNYFSDHGYEPLTRCRQVSSKFQQFFNNGTLNYITTGTVNRERVICVSNTKGGPCTGVLFTLKPEEDANRVIQNLFDIRSGAGGPLEESGSRLYFDINNYLKNLTDIGRSSSRISPNSGASGSHRSGGNW
ncbi:MAG TPA: COP23 domain-containing protein [Kamptonema sp.]|nr:COP23 domain-containing protein [Kamptonema sp.]